MSNESRIEVINRDGWRKEYGLRGSIAYVGSQAGSTIVLPAEEVAPRHLQYLPSQVNRGGYRVVNLSGAEVQARLRGGVEPRAVAPRSMLEIGDGDEIEIAGYRLVFHSGDQQSQAIQVRVEMPATVLQMDRPLDGALVIRNNGEKAGVQFAVAVEGLDPRFVQVEPGPVLFPGVEKRVGFRIAHSRLPSPPAGDLNVTFVVTAPDAYPGETAAVNQRITIAPFYAHKMRFLPIEAGMGGYVLT